VKAATIGICTLADYYVWLKDRQQLLELIKYYDLEVHYHPKKVNVIAVALSRKVHCNYLPVVPMTSE
jgi:hypothetical protein